MSFKVSSSKVVNSSGYNGVIHGHQLSGTCLLGAGGSRVVADGAGVAEPAVGDVPSDDYNFGQKVVVFLI